MYNMYTYKGIMDEIERTSQSSINGFDEHDELGQNYIREFEDKIEGSRTTDEEKSRLRNELQNRIDIDTRAGDKKRGEFQENWNNEQEARRKDTQIKKYKNAWKARNPLWKVTHRKLNPKNMELEAMTSEEIRTSEEMNRVRK